MEVVAVLLLVMAAAILFATEAVRVDVVAVIVLGALGDPAPRPPRGASCRAAPFVGR